MKYILFFTLLFNLSQADITNIDSFEADFTQEVINDKGSSLVYKGHIKATKPQFALWEYKTPVIKSIYITRSKAVIVEPEIEQVIVKNIGNDFDFFNIISKATKTEENTYKAKFQNILYTVVIKKKQIESILYKDELENDIIIHFTQQIQNTKIPLEVFTPHIPNDYDIIQG